MHTYFHGWRRKAGCVTLVMACVVTIAWGRSLFIMDDFVFTPASETSSHLIASAGGLLRWDHTTSKHPFFVEALVWDSYPLHSPDAEKWLARYWDPDAAPEVGAVDIKWKWEWYGLRLGSGYQNYLFDGDAVPADFAAIVIPYWCIAIPLTLLSAYLILWKPRKRA
jgi:hypothetical protein